MHSDRAIALRLESKCESVQEQSSMWKLCNFDVRFLVKKFKFRLLTRRSATNEPASVELNDMVH